MENLKQRLEELIDIIESDARNNIPTEMDKDDPSYYILNGTWTTHSLDALRIKEAFKDILCN